jgi:PPOX class probable F420-dependent enzyme
MSRVFTAAERRFLERMRVARLATTDAAGQPHVIPVVFATDGHTLYTPLDDKPKGVAWRDLKRVRNLAANPQVAFVADHYSENWSDLGWVLVFGRADIIERGEAHATGVRLLHARYPQYETMPLEHRPLVVITPLRVSSWGNVE